MSEYPQQYLEGIRCFNHGEYFECHELLEELWLDAGGLHEIFYQALIQAAVSIYHLERKNLWGATSLYQASLDKLSKIPDSFLGLDVRHFEKEMSRFFEPYMKLEPGDAIEIEASRIPKIELQENNIT